jgi:deoxycytidylate deaminase
MQVDINKFQRKAIEVILDEELNTINKQKIVAFVLNQKGHVLTVGWNSYIKTHPKQKEASILFGEVHKQYLHAEVCALTRLNKKQLGKQSAIVIIRLDSKNNLLPSCPCRICASVIHTYNIKTIIHS